MQSSLHHKLVHGKNYFRLCFGAGKTRRFAGILEIIALGFERDIAAPPNTFGPAMSPPAFSGRNQLLGPGDSRHALRR